MNSIILSTGETLIFDEAAHAYTIDGESCPGTHALMERHGIVKPMNQYSAPYAMRGSRVDVMTSLDDEGDLDEASVDGSERGYLDAWRLFKKEHGVEILSIQQLVGSAYYWFATSIDRVAMIGDMKVNINIKTGHQYPKPHAIQCHLEGLLHPAERFLAVYLDPAGTYEIVDYSSAEWNEAAETALDIAKANGSAHRYMKARKRTKKAVEV